MIIRTVDGQLRADKPLQSSMQVATVRLWNRENLVYIVIVVVDF